MDETKGKEAKATADNKPQRTGHGNKPKAMPNPPHEAAFRGDPGDAVYDIAAYTEGTTAWEQFSFAPELVVAALKLANKEKCTLSEAKAIVKAFAERQVF